VFCDIAKGKTGLLRTLIADYQAIKEAGFMDERFPCYDGLWLTIKLAAACDIAYVDEILLDKREHPASVSKGLRMEAGMQELTGIHQNLLPLLPMYASEQEQALIKSSWARVLRSFAAHTH
jgi:hypothetical protein